MTDSQTFDPFWEHSRAEGLQISRYPHDHVVTFTYRYAPRTKQRDRVRILEIGCGTGNNLWFAAREGFRVSGIDASQTAVEYAKRRLAEDGLQGEFRVGDFAHPLPFPRESFDLAIDRCSLTCCGLSTAKQAILNVRRVLLPGGRFLFNPYSKKHHSFPSGAPGPDGLTLDIQSGTLVNCGQICFYDKDEVMDVLGEGWAILSLQHLEIVEEREGSDSSAHAEWRVVVEKWP